MSEVAVPKLIRNGSTVCLEIYCASDYAAMLVYDKMLKEARDGLLVLPFKCVTGDDAPSGVSLPLK